MCGITGFISFKNSTEEENTSELQSMSHSLKHRGPDSSGVWNNGQVFLGHQRLSIIDLSPEGHQPMNSHCERYVIAFNGEIYNYLALKENLKKAGHLFRGHSDTEVLITAISAWGLEKTLKEISGMFSFALWDKKQHTLQLVRDHIGKKPLYFGVIANKFYFCSELKAIQTLHAKELTIDRSSFNLYLQYGYIPSPYSIYENIYKLRPGHTIKIHADDKSVLSKNLDYFTSSMAPYWSVNDVKKRSQKIEYNSEEALKKDLKEKLTRAVKNRMISDVPIGSFLSGGIDSSLITALMQEQSTSPINTYTIGFEISEFDESPYAIDVAKHLGTNHTTHIISDRDTRNIIPDLGTIYDEPFSDISQIPTYHVCHLAKGDSTVVLSGDGGDEVFCGYSRYFLAQQLLGYTEKTPQSLRYILSTLILSCPLTQLNKIIKLLSPHIHLFNKNKISGKRLHSIARYLIASNSIDITQLIHSQAPQVEKISGYDHTYPDTYSDKDALLKINNNLEQMMLIDMSMYLPDDILVKTDRASMANSIEIRSPLLDKDLIEWSMSIPIEQKINNNTSGKKPLYDLLSDYIPTSMIDRPKQGFSIPISHWLKTSLNEWAEDLLSETALNNTGLYNTPVVRKLWHDFMSEKVDNPNIIWSILMAQTWYKTWHKT